MSGGDGYPLVGDLQEEAGWPLVGNVNSGEFLSCLDWIRCLLGSFSALKFCDSGNELSFPKTFRAASTGS